MSRWKAWATASVLLGVATAYAAPSFAAAISLGYDRYPEGDEIIVGWGKAMLALLPCSLACALLARRSYRAKLRGEDTVLDRSTPPTSITLTRIVVAALLLPTLVGVAVFTILAFLPSTLVTGFDPNPDVGLSGTIAPAAVFGAFFGAAYGPALIPVAAAWLLVAERRGTPRLESSWALIVLALAATAVGYGWALDAVKLP